MLNFNLTQRGEQNIWQGNRASLDTQPLHDGYAYFCTDDGSFHIDYADSENIVHRKQISAHKAENITDAVAVDSTELNKMLEEVLV